jgi:hypothetical protein
VGYLRTVEVARGLWAQREAVVVCGVEKCVQLKGIGEKGGRIDG